MRILKNNKKVYGYDELPEESKKKALFYIESKKAYNKEYFYTVNDFEWFNDGKIMFNTNNIDAF